MINICCFYPRGSGFLPHYTQDERAITLQDDFGRDLRLSPYALGKWPRILRLLRRARLEGCIMAALPPRLPLPAGAEQVLPIANGRRLTLALLPQILDRQLPGWRDTVLGLEVKDAYACSAALRLSAETDRIALSGIYATKMATYLYSRHGLAVERGFGQHRLLLNDAVLNPSHLYWQQGLLPLEIAEAVLLATQQPPLTCDLPYLERLSKRAAACGFSL